LSNETSSFYLLDETKEFYKLKAKIGQEKERYPQSLFSKGDPLIQRMTGSEEAIVKEELKMAQDKMSELQAAKKMSELDAQISVPIFSLEMMGTLICASSSLIFFAAWSSDILSWAILSSSLTMASSLPVIR